MTPEPPRGSVAYYEAKARREQELADDLHEQQFRHSCAATSYRNLAKVQREYQERCDTGETGECLVIRYTPNEDGSVTAQIVEHPAAISQGADRRSAMRNVLQALIDLNEPPIPDPPEPTSIE